MDERYSRQILFSGIGKEGQRRLLQSRALIVGCGALGSAWARVWPAPELVNCELPIAILWKLQISSDRQCSPSAMPPSAYQKRLPPPITSAR